MFDVRPANARLITCHHYEMAWPSVHKCSATAAIYKNDSNFCQWGSVCRGRVGSPGLRGMGRSSQSHTSSYMPQSFSRIHIYCFVSTSIFISNTYPSLIVIHHEYFMSFHQRFLFIIGSIHYHSVYAKHVLLCIDYNSWTPN